MRIAFTAESIVPRETKISLKNRVAREITQVSVRLTGHKDTNDKRFELSKKKIKKKNNKKGLEKSGFPHSILITESAFSTKLAILV